MTPFEVYDYDGATCPAHYGRIRHELERAGQAIGAINLSTHSTRTTRNEMREQFLPELNRVAEQISSMTV